MPGPQSRRRCFTLRTLLVLVTGLCVLLAAVAGRSQHAGRQRRAIQALEARGGWVRYERSGNPTFQPPRCLEAALGRDFFDDVELVVLPRGSCSASPVCDGPPHAGAAVYLCDLPRVEQVTVFGEGASDAALAHIGRLRRLEALSILEGDCEGASRSNSRTPPCVTDLGITSLKGLPRLRSVYVTRARLSDRALVALAACPNLEHLVLVGDTGHFTDEGLRCLASCRGLQTLILEGEFQHAGITDAGIASLHGLENLSRVSLRGRRISDRGLESLAVRCQLLDVTIASDAVTSAGVERFRERCSARCKVLPGSALASR